MKKFTSLIILGLMSLTSLSALEPLKVAIMNNSSTAVSVQVKLNDYTGGTATTKYTGAMQSLTPNGSGIIIVQVANNIGTDWDNITATEVNSYYILDVLVGGTLYAQYRLDQLILSQSQSDIYNNNGNLAPSTSGANDLGEDNNRWGELYVQGNTIHIGPDGGMAGTDELAFSYDDGTNTATMTVAGTTALTSVNDNINIPQQATIDGMAIGQGAGDITSNTAVGEIALASNTTGFENTAIGQSALNKNTTGNNNTAVGASALRDNTSGASNSAVGVGALQSNTIGSNNTAVGTEAMQFNTEGNNNVAIGKEALDFNTTGNENIAVGTEAMRINQTGSRNTAVGHNTFYNNTTGNYNTAIGYQALVSNTTGSENTAIGYHALQDNTTGGANTALGREAMKENTIGIYNTALGIRSLENHISGNNNAALGNRSGASITTGSNNTFLGTNAGNNASQKTDAQNSIAIGANTHTTADNQVVIGDANITETQLRGVTLMDLTSGGTQNIQVDNTGKIVVGGASPFTHDAVNKRVYRNDPDDDFIFGDDDFDWTSGFETKMFFDKSKGAFRAGAALSNWWDDSNVGLYSASMGILNHADDFASFAMGYQSQANGYVSTAIGQFTRATGNNSTSMNYDTDAIGDASFAMGFSTDATGNYSTSMGYVTIADEESSTALGMFNDNTITGELLTVGNGTNVNARSNAFEVYKNGDVVIPTLAGGGTQNIQVDNTGKIVVGGASPFTHDAVNNRVYRNDPDDDFIFGDDDFNHSSGSEMKMFFDKSKGSFRAGTVTGTAWDDANIGNNSFASGINTTASGNNSIAMGVGAVANNANSTAIGGSTASGINSLAMGTATTASGDFSSTMGVGTRADENESTSIGMYNDETITGEIFTVGNGTNSSNRSNAFEVYKNGNVVMAGSITANPSGADKDFIFGDDDFNHSFSTETKMFFDKSKGSFRAGTVAGNAWDEVNIGTSSIALGNNLTASGNNSTALGNNAIASGSASTAMGVSTTASGAFSTAMGYNTISNQSYSTAMGHSTTASGIYSTAMGNQSISSNIASTSMGFQTTASGNSSTAMGVSTTASGDFSTAMGNRTLANESESVAMGMYNDYTITGELLTIGNGTGNTARTNAFEVYKNGNVVIGDDANATHTVRGIMNMNQGINANGSSSSVAVHFSATEPSSPLTGSLWYDTGASALKIWNGGAWVNI